MNIGVDIRSLMNPWRSGVGEYTYNLLDNLFRLDQKNRYFLFYNSFHQVDENLPAEWKGRENVKFCGFGWPNKLFNAGLKFLKYPKIDSLIGKIDLFFVPNIQFLSLSDNCQKVITVHDLSFERYPEFFSLKRRWWHKAVNPQKIIKQADKVMADSENTKQDLIKIYGVELKKVKVIYPGIAVSNIKCQISNVKNKYNLPDKFILYLGTLEPRKNIVGLIKAFEKLISTYNLQPTSYKLVIAGFPGWNYREIYQAAKNSGVADKIKFIGPVAPADKPALYSLASVFIYPSFYEGFGFPPLEAMAAGRPVITSFNSSLGEIGGDAALLIDPYNISEMAEAIYQVLTDEGLSRQLAEKGKERVRKFSWQKTVEETLKIFQNEV